MGLDEAYLVNFRLLTEDSDFKRNYQQKYVTYTCLIHVFQSSQKENYQHVIKVLEYLECPQYLRKQLFPSHKYLEHVGLVSPVEAPHHLKLHDEWTYREGVVTDTPTKDDRGSWVDIGLKNVKRNSIQQQQQLSITQGLFFYDNVFFVLLVFRKFKSTKSSRLACASPCADTQTTRTRSNSNNRRVCCAEWWLARTRPGNRTVSTGATRCASLARLERFSPVGVLSLFSYSSRPFCIQV